MWPTRYRLWWTRYLILLDGTFTLRGLVLDDLLVSSGTYPGSVTVTGKFFGTKKGKTYLYDSVNDKKKNLKITAWKMNPSTGVSELTFAVPKPSKSFSCRSLSTENQQQDRTSSNKSGVHRS